jgi:hypothetical protein
VDGDKWTVWQNFIWTRVCIGCRSPRQSNPGVNELQTRGKPWLALLKYKMSKAAKTWPFTRADDAAEELAGDDYSG